MDAGQMKNLRETFRDMTPDEMREASREASIEVKDIYVAFLPCNQPYTMTPEQVAKAARTIKPKVLFPYHYSQTPIKQVADLLTGSGIDVRIRNFQ